MLDAIARSFARIERADVRATEEAEALVRVGALTPREKEVMEGLAHGHPNKAIAFELGVSSRTVEVHAF